MTDTSTPSQPFSLKRAFTHLQDGLLHDLGASEIAFHPTAKGDNAELNWIKMLERFLPQRYRVDRAFVVDVNDRVSDQLDVVIYDAQYTPLLFEHEGGLYIPAESVYGVFEAKPELTKGYVEYAGRKVASVRRLERTSAAIVHAGGEYTPVTPKTIIGGLVATRSSWNPPFGDPLRVALDARTDEERLDLGCAPSAGAFEYTRDDDGATELQACTTDKAMLFFLMRLFHRLQGIGTVPAMDINRWGNAAWG
jgi:Domain of unknown function (DUF6602)